MNNEVNNSNQVNNTLDNNVNNNLNKRKASGILCKGPKYVIM